MPAPAPAPVPASPLPEADSPDPAASPELPPSPPTHWRLSVGAQAGTFDFKVPRLVPDVAAFADLATDSPKLLAPSFRLAVHHTPQSETDNNQTSAELTWTFVRVDACPLHVTPVRTLSLRPCAFLDAGALAANGGAIPTSFVAGSDVRPWFAGGALARVEWTLLDPIALEAAGGALFSFTRDSFDSAEGGLVYEAPPAVPFASLGFAGRFP